MSLTLKRKKGKNFWIIGTVCGERIRESTRTSDRRLAEAKLIKRMDEIRYQAIHGRASSYTFAEAMEFYISRANPSPKQAWFLGKLLAYWGQWRCQDITTAALIEYEKVRHSGGVKNATLRRSIYGPMTAVLNMAAKNGLCQPVLFAKPKATRTKVAAAPEDYLCKLLDCEMENWLRCVVLTMTLHGTRPSDLKRLRWKDVSFSNSVITFGKTKNGEAHAPLMHSDVRSALLAYFAEVQWWKGDKIFVFPQIQGNEPATTINVYLKSLCKKNGLPFYSTHKIGRHAFAERILNDSHTLKEVQQAGNWASIQVVAELYGHLERSKVDKIVTGMKIGRNQTQTSEALEIKQPDQALTK